MESEGPEESTLDYAAVSLGGPSGLTVLAVHESGALLAVEGSTEYTGASAVAYRDEEGRWFTTFVQNGRAAVAATGDRLFAFGAWSEGGGGGSVEVGALRSDGSVDAPAAVAAGPRASAATGGGVIGEPTARQWLRAGAAPLEQAACAIDALHSGASPCGSALVESVSSTLASEEEALAASVDRLPELADACRPEEGAETCAVRLADEPADALLATGEWWEEELAVIDELRRVIRFPDPNLRAAVLHALDQPMGDVLAPELERLSGELGAGGWGVVDLTGLEHATTIEFLHLGDNLIEDLGPLGGMNQLVELTLHENRITDVSRLAGMGLLQRLTLSGNQIADLEPLESLESLQRLSLNGIGLSDLSPLTHLRGPDLLSLTDNQIVDIEPLLEIYLGEHSGPGPAVRVRLDGNPLGEVALCEVIPTLESRGVVVTHDGEC